MPTHMFENVYYDFLNRDIKTSQINTQTKYEKKEEFLGPRSFLSRFFFNLRFLLSSFEMWQIVKMSGIEWICCVRCIRYFYRHRLYTGRLFPIHYPYYMVIRTVKALSTRFCVCLCLVFLFLFWVHGFWRKHVITRMTQKQLYNSLNGNQIPCDGWGSKQGVNG